MGHRKPYSHEPHENDVFLGGFEKMYIYVPKAKKYQLKNPLYWVISKKSFLMSHLIYDQHYIGLLFQTLFTCSICLMITITNIIDVKYSQLFYV